MNRQARQIPHHLPPRSASLEPRWDMSETLPQYDPNWANQPYPDPNQYIVIDTTQTSQTALTPVEAFTRSLQNMFQMQAAMMRELDSRMSYLEQARPAAAPNPGQFYAQTWWALWGILMLIIGSALVVVILLIFRS